MPNPDPAVTQNLIARVEGEEGSSIDGRYLAVEIIAATLDEGPALDTVTERAGRVLLKHDWAIEILETTDAALAFVRTCGFVVCDVEFSLTGRLPTVARIRTWEKQGGAVGRGPSFKSEHKRPARAILAATLRALQGGSDGR